MEDGGSGDEQGREEKEEQEAERVVGGKGEWTCVCVVWWKGQQQTKGNGGRGEG